MDRSGSLPLLPFHSLVILILSHDTMNRGARFTLWHSTIPFILYQLFSRVTRTLTIIFNKNLQKWPFYWLWRYEWGGYLWVFIWNGGRSPLLGPFYYTTLFPFYKSPEKKWRRSVKMDKNINVHFSKVPGKCCNGGLWQTRCQHNAANCGFWWKCWLHTFLSVLVPKWFRCIYQRLHISDNDYTKVTI